jgi:hypothetical protein
MVKFIDRIRLSPDPIKSPATTAKKLDSNNREVVC